ncbi:MAG TPA: hypothetical protein DER02_05870 [Gammaproteobacteria bacterium]|nr:hypothetical protein [Gammaproteobacteria bacterium]|tara:strand:+ start:6025 stop:8088 length:2064 start_codon:yes stop_codon:yes gene_type:complete
MYFTTQSARPPRFQITPLAHSRRNYTALLVTLGACLLVALSGCQQTATENPSEAPLAAEVATTNAPTPAAKQPVAWQRVAATGEALCSDGSEYAFFVRPGDPEKVLFYLQGGGACWTRATCDLTMQPSYKPNLQGERPPQFGIFNFDNTDNPFQDYSVVYAPYCSGDVHLGDVDAVYPGIKEGQAPLTIFHRGRANAQAALDWTYTNLPTAQQLFVTGSSAGSLPSPYYATILAEHYADAKVVQLGDGAGGYRLNAGDNNPYTGWQTQAVMAATPGFEALGNAEVSVEALYSAAAKAQPSIQFSQYDAAYDSVQRYFLAIGGQADVDLLSFMKANIADIEAVNPGFRSFVLGGESHTVLGRPQFYAWAVGDVSVRDWVAALAKGEPVRNVLCEDCKLEEFVGTPLTPALQQLWASWEDPKTQYVKPFQIFDNVYYVGIDWVAAYLIDTGAGLVLIDSLYGKWTQQLIKNIQELGFNPAEIKYVLTTHGHFDHAGGSAIFQKYFGSTIVMNPTDWQIATAKPDTGLFYMPTPRMDRVAQDGDVIVLGDNQFELFHTPGHTEGVLSIRYSVRDGNDTYTALTLGGVGLNFSGVARTEMYLESYARLQAMQEGVSVSLPNHQAMGSVFRRRDALAERQAGQPHPFVDPVGYKQSLASFIAAAEDKLAQEKAGTAIDPAAALLKAIQDEKQ